MPKQLKLKLESKTSIRLAKVILTNTESVHSWRELKQKKYESSFPLRSSAIAPFLSASRQPQYVQFVRLLALRKLSLAQEALLLELIEGEPLCNATGSSAGNALLTLVSANSNCENPREKQDHFASKMLRILAAQWSIAFRKHRENCLPHICV